MKRMAMPLWRKRIALLAGLCIPAVCPQLALCEVVISGVAGTFLHRDTAVISGRGFGAKNPAAPLIWDDGEDRAVNNPAAVREKGWTDPWPTFGKSPEHYIQYRSSPFRSTPAPHAYSTKYLVGGHFQDPGNSPPYIGVGAEGYRNVMVTASAGAARPRWFAMFYYRLDPLWRYDSPPWNNHKTAVVQSGPTAYYEKGFSYDNYRIQSPERTDAPSFNYHGVPLECASSSPSAFPPTHSPRVQWIHYEERIANDAALGFKDLYIDNVPAMRFVVNCPNWFSQQGGDYASGIMSFTIGGYYRWATDINDSNSFRGDSNHFRYFDDMYVDTTLSRVILADSATYENATLLEPQIPQAWSDGSISIHVNRGRLPGGQPGFLFVFDADGNRNASGYPLGNGSAPASPRLRLHQP